MINPGDFYYRGFEISENQITYHFNMGGHVFTPRWTFPFALNAADPRIKQAAFNLGMAELISYWKAACPENVYVECGELSDGTIAWWKKLYFHGLGEFFFRNHITLENDRGFMNIISAAFADTIIMPPHGEPPHGVLKGTLIPVGGGKDSIVTMEMLGTENNDAFLINGTGHAVATARLAGFSDEHIIQVKRVIDPELLIMNKAGALNGHTPFSSIVAFASFIAALALNKQYIALSNESSANEGNVPNVNHQYSKSIAFERDFRELTNSQFGTEKPEYFSLLRPLNEWQITKRFVRHDKYLTTFLSCNIGGKKDRWCGACAKCLYVYIMLAAFLPDAALIPVFGVNMLGNDSETFVKMISGLVTPGEEKPWECVGTREEINHALFAATMLRLLQGVDLPVLLRKFHGKESAYIDDCFNEDNFVPETFVSLLKGDV